MLVKPFIFNSLFNQIELYPLHPRAEYPFQYYREFGVRSSQKLTSICVGYDAHSGSYAITQKTVSHGIVVYRSAKELTLLHTKVVLRLANH